MEDLIKALQIFLKYGNPQYPTNCSHDELHIEIEASLVSDQDKEELERLSFTPNEYDGFSSFRFGSC